MKRATKFLSSPGQRLTPGPDALVKASREIELDGTGSSSEVLTHQWKLISSPQGSSAALSDSAAPKPKFKPDVNGRYTFALTVNDGYFNSDQDTINVDVTPLATAVPIQTFYTDTTGKYGTAGKYGILFNETLYSDSDHLPFNSGVQLLILDRKTLGFIAFQTFHQDQLNNIPDYLSSNAPDNTRVVIMSTGVNGTGFGTQEFSSALEAFGATQEVEGIDDNDIFSFIGIRGINPGQAFQVGLENINLVGNFMADANSNYAFTQIDYVDFHIKLSTDDSTPTVITIGDNPPVQSLSGQYGIILIILDRATLRQLWAKSYVSYPDFPDLVGDINRNLQEGFLMVVATFGNPAGRTLVQWGLLKSLDSIGGRLGI